MNPGPTPNEPQDADSSVRRVLRTLARVLLQPIALALIVQPAVYAAPNPSLLSQWPQFIESSAASNVVFLMDDSTSMMDIQLPIPPGITPAASGSWSWKFPLNRKTPLSSSNMIFDSLARTHRVGGALYTPDDARADWILRSPTLNPAYYNPAIQYKPWNNDGARLPDPKTKLPSDTSITTEPNGFRTGRTLHDPRYRGPNYTSSSSTSKTVLNWQGANALHIDSTGIKKTAFDGWSPAGNQDLFSRRMEGATAPCTAWNLAYVYSIATCSVATTPSVLQYSPVSCSDPTTPTGPWTSAPPSPTSCTSPEGNTVSYSPQSAYRCSTGTQIGGTGSTSTCCSGTVTTTPTLCSGTTGPLACPCSSSTLQWVVNPSTPVFAHYYRYNGPNTLADKGNPANYTMVEIERYDDESAASLEASTQLFPIYTTDGKTFELTDPNFNAVRPDCTATVSVPDGSGGSISVKGCTWAEEAQNFANWYTYYRTRLFAAIAVTAEALSELKASNGLDNLRLGYGSINYFNNSRDPFSVINPWDFNQLTAPARTVADVDVPPTVTTGFVSNEGVITRGVRPFAQGSPEREQVFDWLFSVRTQGATPNREALDSVGRYFSRQDAFGPWSAYPGGVPAVDARPVNQHESCRRSYTILVTDGEWTNTTGGVQPLLESRSAPPSWVASQAGSTPLDAASHLTAPVFNDGTHKDAKLDDYKVFPPPAGKTGHLQPQFNSVTGSPTGTLSDVAYYWWSRDLRPDLVNGVRPEVDVTKPEKRNESFWQNVTPYIVGYGLNATMETSTPLPPNPPTRTSIMNRTSVSWPTVDTTPGLIQDAQCSNLDVNGAPSGCGRVNDTFRAARLARGDFLVATNIEELARKVAEAFAVAGEVEATATSFAGRSANLRSGDRLYTASFKTNVWSGKIEAFDALALNAAVLSGTALPASLATTNFSNGRFIFLSSTMSGGGASFDPSNSTQQTDFGATEHQLKWLKGDQSVELQNGGTLRNRGTGDLLGDIVHSQAVYSKVHDAGYNAARRPAAASVSGTGTQPVSLYAQFLKDNEDHRPAALYVGANDGMLHAFNASDLSERFAYIPRAVHSTVKELTQPSYQHKYFVDGPVVIGDVYMDATKGWRTVLVGTTGNGPAGIFALDVTQRIGSASQAFSASDVLWDRVPADTVGGDHSTDGQDAKDHLGHITQPGVIGSGLDGRWYYFVGNGWESVHDKARLLAIDIKTGAIKAFSTDDDGGVNPVGVFDSSDPAAAQPNGLGGVTPVYDGQRNVVAIYAGDRHGRLWKFDFSGTAKGTADSPAATTLSATVKKLFTAEDAANKRQPITAAPRVSAHPRGGRLIVFGTGRLTESADIGSTDIQSIYAVWEKKPSASSFTALKRGALYQFTFNQTGSAANRSRERAITNLTTIDWSKDGWYIDLVAAGNPVGERIVAAPISDSGFVELTSFEPVAGGDSCQGGGASFHYCFDIAGSFTRSCFLDSSGNPLPPGTMATETVPSISGVVKLKKPSDEVSNPAGPVTLTSAHIPTNPADQNKATQACDTFGSSGSGGAGNGGFVVGTKVIDGKRNASVKCEPVRTWREIPRN